VNPDEVVKEYGADSVRLFEMFMGPLEDTKPWSTRGVEGVYRFLNRVWRLFVMEDGSLDPSIQMGAPTKDFERLHHQTVKKVGEDIESLRLNTAISQMMIYVNETMKLETKPRELLEEFVLLLAPFSPHIAEELWNRLGHPKSIAYQQWPSYSPEKTIESTVEVVFQVNGKVRSKLQVAFDTAEGELERLALSDAAVRRYVDGKRIVRKVVVRNKLVNVVVS
jgi:leucyl-tRNA synthetase